MLEANSRISRAHRRDRSPPELRTRQHVGLIHGAQTARAVFRARVRKSRDALDVRCRVRFRVKGAFDAFFDGVSALTKVQSAREFAHNLKIKIPQALRFKR